MKFGEWLKLQETGTSVAAVSGGGGGTDTGCIAQFKQPLGGIHRRSSRKKKKDKSVDIDTALDKI